MSVSPHLRGSSRPQWRRSFRRRHDGWPRHATVKKTRVMITVWWIEK